MKILIVFTGGTIGSSVNNGTISPDCRTKYLLLENYKAKAQKKDEPVFQSIEPYTVLSENLSAENINLLIQAIKENIGGGYDGIIVTHGTDTIQFTASALHYAFKNEALPIILVSSNYPLSESGENGDFNFEAAVEFIAGKAAKGVFVAYANDPEKVDFHCADSLLMHHETKDGLHSINDNSFAFYCGGKIIKNERYTASGGVEAKAEFKLKHHSQILVVSCYPGASYAYSFDGYKAIIFRPYHSGTLNTDSPELRAFCEDARKRNLPMFIVNVPGGNAYESSAVYSQLGIRILPFCTFASAYMSLWIALSENSAPFEK